MAGGKGKAIAVVAGIGLLFLLFLQGKKPPSPPPPGTGPVTPAGGIANVDVAQQRGQRARVGLSRRRGLISMGSHLVSKTAGDTIFITAVWSAATKSSTGVSINWNYGISWRWKRPGEFLFGGWANIGSRGNGTYTFTFSDTYSLTPLNYPLFKGKNWDIEVTLHADRSSPDGQPLNDMPTLEDDALALNTKQHPQALQVV